MSVHAAVQEAFGSQVTIDGTDSIHPYSLVWWARVHGPDDDVPAVVKRTWGSGQQALEGPVAEDVRDHLLDELAPLERGDLDAAWAYHATNPAEIETAIRENDEAE